MAAVIGFDKDKLEDICRQQEIQIANFNSPDQIVITGHRDRIDAACPIIKEAGAMRVIPLDVAGAFHSSLMQPAAEKFEKYVKDISFSYPPFEVVSNVDAIPSEDPDQLKDNLPKQIVSSVQWEQTIRNIAKEGTTTFIEIGPGTVLKGLIRNIDRSYTVHNIQKPEDIETLSF